MKRILPPHFFDSDEDYHDQFHQVEEEQDEPDDEYQFEDRDRDCDYYMNYEGLLMKTKDELLIKTKDELLRELADRLLCGMITKAELLELIEQYDRELPF